MPIVLVAAGIAAAGAVGSSLISSHAANNASNQAANAAAANNALQEQIYNSNKGLIQPYVDRGNSAANELQGFLGLGGSPQASQDALNTYLNSTGYQFNKNEGMSAITGNKAAAGLLNSGSTLEALDQFGAGLADQYGQQYVGNLENVSNTGVGAINSLTGAGTNYANQVSANNNSAASAAGSAGIYSANAANNGISNALNAFASFRGNSAGLGGTSFLGGGAGSNAGSFSAPWGG